MGCREVRDRLVAWQDAELSPGEAAQLEEHLRACADCRRRERALDASRPRADLARAVPAEIRAALDARLDPDVLLAAASARPAPPAPTVRDRMGAWLRSETRVPMGLVVVYLALLLGALGFGVSGLWPSSAPSPTVTDVQAIPAGQFRPASYDPGAERGDGVE